MAIYFASVDMKSASHDYGILYAHLGSMDAHQAQSSAWLIESAGSLRGLSDELLAFLHRDDSLFLIEISPATAWAATHLAERTGEWLKQKRP